MEMRKMFKTPLGLLRAIGNEKGLSRLDFVDQEEFFDSKQSSVMDSIGEELERYFKGKLKSFKTPISPQGTPFQISVWKELLQIPFGRTRSYAEMAAALGKPTAYRAVANANGANPLVILVPCHRVIYTGGGLGGYSSGIERKIWLLDHEGRK